MAGVVTLICVGLVSYFQAKDALIDKASMQLQAIRQIKKNQLLSYFDRCQADAKVFSQQADVVQALSAYSMAFYKAGANSTVYDSVNQIYHSSLSQLKQAYGYYDLFLVSPEGDVVYSEAHESDFATNLISGPYNQENIAEVFKLGKNKVSLVDFDHYEPSNGEPASFIAAPVYFDRNSSAGVLILQIPLDKIDEIMMERSGMGETGETYIVGEDYLMRTDSRFSERSVVLNREVRTKAVEEALAHRTATAQIADYRNVQVLSSYDWLDIKGLKWVILSEIDYDEVVAPVQQLRNRIIMIAFAAIALVALGAVFLARQISLPMLNVRQALIQMSRGQVTLKVDEDTIFKETSEMAAGINNLIDGIDQCQQFATQIGKGNLQAEFTPLSQEDALGNALLTMRNNLTDLGTKEQNRKWVTEGVHQISEVLRANYENLQELSITVLTKIIKYVDANQGMLYVRNDEKVNQPVMEMQAAYAWDRQKFIESRYALGEGLTGQCWFEGEKIILKKVPDSFVKIGSGIGEANPSNVLYLPIKTSNEVLGILELATLTEFTETHLELLEKLSEVIAATISSTKVNEETSRLLRVTQQQTEELRAQEEEMRQNMEEMQATQEELNRKEKAYLNMITELEQKVKTNEVEK